MRTSSGLPHPAYSSWWKSRLARLRSAWSAAGVGPLQGVVRLGPVVPCGDRAAQGLGLEQQAQVVDMPGLLVVDDPDDGAPVRMHRDQARAGQGLERLADRGLGDAEHRGQVGLDQRAPRLELAGQDGVLDRLEHGHRPGRQRTRGPGQERRLRRSVRNHVSHLIYDRVLTDAAAARGVKPRAGCLTDCGTVTVGRGDDRQDHPRAARSVQRLTSRAR